MIYSAASSPALSEGAITTIFVWLLPGYELFSPRSCIATIAHTYFVCFAISGMDGVPEKNSTSKPSNYSSSRCRAKLEPFRCQIKFSSPKFHCCLIILLALSLRGWVGACSKSFVTFFHCYLEQAGNLCGNSSLLTASLAMFFDTTRIPRSRASLATERRHNGIIKRRKSAEKSS